MRTYAPWMVGITALIIFSLGLLMIFSTTSAEVLEHAKGRSTHQDPLRQICYAFGALFLGALLWKVGYAKVIQSSPKLLIFFIFLLILVLIPGLGKEVNGSKRWLNLAGLSFQPSEFVKFLLPAFFICSYARSTFKDFLKLAGVCAIPLLLILIEPNNGTAAVMGITLIAVFWLMGVPVKFWVLPLGILLIIGALLAMQLPYFTGRLNVYLHPELDLKGRGHQPYQAKIAVGSGQLLGRGPGNSLQKLSYLPEAQNDYIAAIYAEEMGFLGMLGLIVLYLVFSFAGITIALNAPDQRGMYLGGTIVFIIAFQSFLNMAVVAGLVPTTGLNLPLFSQGGTSLMANSAGIGMLLSIGKK